MERLNENQLIEITRREVEWYAGVADNEKSYFVEDAQRRIYLVTSVPDDWRSGSTLIVVQARVVNDFVVIDEDRVWDKNLWKALEKAGVLREQIILAYKGEKLRASVQP